MNSFLCAVFLILILYIQFDETLAKDHSSPLAQLQKSLLEVREELRETKNQLEYISDYSADCFFSKKWSNCKLFTYNNQRKMFAVPRNETEKYGTWDKAKQICNKYGASLADMESKEKNLIFQTFLGEKVANGWYWTSGQVDSNGKFKWTNSGKQIDYTNWNSNTGTTPNNIMGTDNCILMLVDKDNSDNGKWLNYFCNAYTYSIACEFSFNI